MSALTPEEEIQYQAMVAALTPEQRVELEASDREMRADLDREVEAARRDMLTRDARVDEAYTLAVARLSVPRNAPVTPFPVTALPTPEVKP